MPTQACRDGELRLSGLQLPEADSNGGMVAAARSLSVTQTTTYQWTLAEDLAAYRQEGIAGIGLYRPKLEELDEEFTIDAIRNSGLNVTSLSWVGGFTGSDGRKHDEALFDASEAIRFAAAVGAGTVAVFAGGPGQHIERHARRLLGDALRALCDEAADRDVRIALHPMLNTDRTRSVISTLDEALAAIADVNLPNLGLIFDLGAFAATDDLVERIPAVVSKVHAVRFSDRRPVNGRRRYIAEHAASAGAVFNALLEAGYDGPFEFDLWSEENHAASDYRELLGDCRGRFEIYRTSSAVIA